MKFGLARVIKYQELKKATNSFATELGRGGYGKVYLGKLRDGQMVAVKVLFDRDPKRLEHFFNEVTVLSRVRHKNLVSLCGCTNPTSPELLLVYEYVPNGTVAEHLHGQLSALNWAARIRIAVETAEALAYIHGLEPPIIHRDVKTSNILLDDAFHAKLADLGICRLLPWDAEHVSTLPQGTMGYRDPEYDRYFRLSDKTDVYSFGVVLMELISGQQAVDVNRDPEDIYLDSMAIRKIKNHKLEEFVDPRLGYGTNNDSGRMINSVAQLAAECLQPTGNTRPSMVQVVTVLKEIQNEMEQLGLNDVTTNEALNLRVFTFEELRIATRNFRPDAMLGDDDFGKPFKGWIDEKTLNPVRAGHGMKVAVKKLDFESFQGLEEWQSGVNFVGRLSHPNIAKLLGYCVEDKKNYNAKLSNIGSPKNVPTGGLSYIKRDFDSEEDETVDYAYRVIPGFTGTPGYIDPAYIAKGRLSVKSNVYGFGVVLLEMLSGRRAWDIKRPRNEQNFVDGAKPFLTDRRKLAQIMDPKLEGKYPLKGAFKAAQLTVKCLAGVPKDRPSMKEVVETLEHIEAQKGR